MNAQDFYRASVDEKLWMAYTLKTAVNPNILRYGRLNERSIVRSHIDSRYPGTVLYDIPTYLNLNEYVHKKMKRAQVLAMLRRIISMAEDITESGFNWSNLVWDWNLIFVNPTDDDNLMFLVIPESIPDPKEGELEELIRVILSNARYDLAENCHYVAHLLTVLNESMNTRDLLKSMGETVRSLSMNVYHRSRAAQPVPSGAQTGPGSWDKLFKKHTGTLEGPGEVTPRNRPVLRRMDTGELIRADKDSFFIGKDPSRVDYVIPGVEGISRRHISIFRDGNSYFIQDENSTNGTFIDGVQLAPYDRQLLVKGYVISLAGQVELQVSFE